MRPAPGLRLTSLALLLGLVGSGGALSARAASHPEPRIHAVGAENEYANVISQIGGRYVSVSAIMSDPNTDPHTFEVSPKVAELVSAASLVVQNGVGYDSFMNRIEAAAPNPGRRVIEAQSLLHLPASTANPHLWYKPGTMTAVARALVLDLSRLEPSASAYFRAREAAFDRSLRPWLSAIAQLRSRHQGAPVATTEPVGDYMLEAAGLNNRTPWTLQADIMNGVDPSPQEVSFQEQLFNQHRVKVFLYNQQVTDSLTASLLSLAQRDGIPVVGVYETMPTPGYDYQSWMLAECRALLRALSDERSTTRL